MKYVIVKSYENKKVNLTRPASAKQTYNSFERFKGIGIKDIEIVPVKNIKRQSKSQESFEELLKTKKDFEKINE